MNKIKILNIKKLFFEKKYSDVIILIENNFSDKEKSSEVLNLLGVSKLQKKNSNNFDLLSATEDFKKSYLKEKNTSPSIEGLANFIVCCIKSYQYEDAIKYFKEAEVSLGYNLRLSNLMIRIYERLSDVDKILYYLEKMIENKDLQNYTLLRYIYYNSFQNKWTQESFLNYSKKIEKTLPMYSQKKLIPIHNKKNKKIKLAFLSSDIREKHSVTKFLETVVENVNRDKFELLLFSNCKINKEDKTSEAFKVYFDKWINISELNDIEGINKIRENKIDIIIDIMGLTSTNRIALFKNRLAQLQILWLGYNNTSGLSQMDYFIADTNLIKKNEVNLYSEKILFLPSIWNCHSGFELLRKEYPTPMIKNKFITFGSFNDFNKISDDVVETWSKILIKINNSRLILKSSDTQSNNTLKRKFKKTGVLNSIIFMSRKEIFEDHLNEYKKIDIALDTFPYNGVTTSFEAIWMCVPLLTLKGFNPNSRSGESINKNINMNYFIANNKQEYVLKAIDLFNNFEKIIDAKKYLFDKALDSNLFNSKKFSKEFFESLEKIYFKNSP